MPKLETIDSNPLYWNRNPERSYPYPPAMAEVVEERDFDTLRASMARVAKVKKQAMLAYIPRRPRDGAMYGLGQVSANSLDDSQVPYKSMPIYLSRITTMDQLEDYAAGGFQNGGSFLRCGAAHDPVFLHSAAGRLDLTKGTEHDIGK